MKFTYLIYFITIFPLFYSVELGGIKFAISEKMANDVLYHFYPDIVKEITSIKLPNIHVCRGVNVEDITMGIPNFTLDKIKVKFTEKGINVNVSGLKAWVKGTIYLNKFLIKDDKDFTIDINEFNLNANLLVKTNVNEENKLVPFIQFTEPPTHTIDFDVDLENMLWILDEALEPIFKSLLKNLIDDFIKDQSNKCLNESFAKIMNITDMPIDDSNGLFIDFSLVDLKMRNGYIEVNSYALLYNKKIDETRVVKRIPITLVPPISSVDNPNQLFVSQYAFNSALFTYFKTYPLSLKLNMNSNILEFLLPSIMTKFANKKTEVFLQIAESPTLEFQQNLIEGKIIGNITINVEGRNTPIFICRIQITTKVQILILKDIIVSGKINDLNIKVLKIDKNEASSTFVIEQINKLFPIVLTGLNEYIYNNLKFSLPVFFKNINLEHKTKYISITYTLKKEIYFSNLNQYLFGIEKFMKQLYFKNDAISFRNKGSLITIFLGYIYNSFFKDIKELITQLDKIGRIISKIEDNINDSNKRKNSFKELSNEIANINNIVNIPKSKFSSLGNVISQFFEKSIGMSNLSPETIKNSNLAKGLDELLTTVMCQLETSIVSMQSLNKNYFIWYDYNYTECYERRYKEIESLTY